MTLVDRIRTYASDPAKILVSARSLQFRYCMLKPLLRSLGDGDIVLDCGANVGKYADIFSRTGAMVYAFEPHPWAFGVLSKRLADRPNVRCIPAAVGVESGKAELHLHVDDAGNPGALSECASLVAEKPNVGRSNTVQVRVISLADFILDMGCAITLLKMDIEGFEYRVLPDLFDRGLHRIIKKIVVETHERIPSLSAAHRDLVSRVRSDRSLRHVSLGWV